MNKLWNLVVLGVLLVSVAVTGCSKSQPPAVPAEAKTMVAREPLQNAAPLGVEIGYANIQGVKKKIGSLATLTDKGVNQYSGGKMLLSRGEGLGLDGLKSVLFIFDKEGVLAGVIMVLPKDPKGTFELLSPKYEKIENKIDSFMNNGYARLGKGDSFIEIDAPHLSFDMEVRYISKGLMSVYKQSSAEQSAKEKQDRSGKM